MHIAAQCEDYDIIRLLLQKGANVKAVDFSRRTPLHFSAQGGFERICRGFINEGADVNATDRSLQTPLHFAASEGESTSPWSATGPSPLVPGPVLQACPICRTGFSMPNAAHL